MEVQTITPGLAAGLRLPAAWGVIVSDVAPGSPADASGLKVQDIITSIEESESGIWRGTAELGSRNLVWRYEARSGWLKILEQDTRNPRCWRFIVPPRDVAPGLYDLTISLCRAAGFAPRITQHARQMQTVLGLVSGGMGFALVPSSVRHLRRTGVKYRQLRGKAAYVEVGILRLRNAVSPLREHFVKALRSVV